MWQSYSTAMTKKSRDLTVIIAFSEIKGISPACQSQFFYPWLQVTFILSPSDENISWDTKATTRSTVSNCWKVKMKRADSVFLHYRLGFLELQNLELVLVVLCVTLHETCCSFVMHKIIFRNYGTHVQHTETMCLEQHQHPYLKCQGLKCESHKCQGHT